MSNITKNLNIYKDVTSLIGARSFGKEDLVVPYRQFNGTKVGSPNIDNNLIVSNFSSSSYITVTVNIDLSKPFEIYARGLTTSTARDQIILSNQTTNATPFRIDALDVGCITPSGSGSKRGIISANEYCDFKGASNGLAWSIYAKKATDNKWVYVWSCPVSYVFNNGDNQLIFGRNTSTYPSQALSGSIDLKRCILQTNDEVIWRGVKGLSQISRNDMQNYVLSGIEMQPVVGDSKAVIDFSNVKLPWKFEHKDKLLTSRFAIAPLGTTVTQQRYMYLNGQWVDRVLNTNKIGGLTVNQDYVASGFSSNSSYAQIPVLLDFSKPWEMVIKHYYTGNGIQCFLTSPTTGSSEVPGFFQNGFSGWIDANNNVTFRFSHDGVNGTTMNAGNISVNNSYYIRGRWDGTTYYAGYSTDGVNYTEASYESTIPLFNPTKLSTIGVHIYTTSWYLRGTVDLKECYFKSGNEYLWRGVEDLGTETLSGCIRYYYGEGEHVTTPPRDSTQYYNIYAVNGDEGVVLDSTYFHEGTMVYNRPIFGDGEIPQFENEWYLGEYRVDTGEDGHSYIPIGPIPDTGV